MDQLVLYFNNKKKCGGGDVTSIILDKKNAFITYADPEGKNCVLMYISTYFYKKV